MRLYARQLVMSSLFFVAVCVKSSEWKMFVSIQFYKKYQEELQRIGTNSNDLERPSEKKICESPKKNFPVFDYDGRACPNAPLKTGKSKYLDAETQLITKSLFK